jgi:hypothetical protein
MTKFNNHNDEAPSNWEEYASLLHNQPTPMMPEEHMAQMFPRIDAAIEGRGRRDSVARWILAPAFSLVVIIAVIFFVNYPSPRKSPETTGKSQVVTKQVEERPRAARRSVRRRLPEPQIPPTQLPASVDTAVLNHRQAPIVTVPQSEPIVPGIRPSNSPQYSNRP